MILKENNQKTSSNSDPKTKSALLDKYEADAKKEADGYERLKKKESN